MLNKILACFFLLIFVVFAAAEEEDSFFCRNKKDNWQICRTCNDTSSDCDGVSNNECKCAGIQIAKKDSCKFLMIFYYIFSSNNKNF